MNDRRMLPLSILHRFVCCLLGLTTVLMRRDLSKDAELLVLLHENAVLPRRAAPAGPALARVAAGPDFGRCCRGPPGGRPPCCPPASPPGPPATPGPAGPL